MSTKTIVAIDVGYGNTKIAWTTKGEKSRQFIFSSQTLRTTESSTTIEGIGELDRIQVEVNKQLFWVGPDMAGEGSNELHGDYANSDVYQALVSGALHYISKFEGVPLDVVDLLVLGLPVSGFQEQKGDLIRRFNRGTRFPNPTGLKNIFGDCSDVQIKKVAVLPQPMGSLLTYGANTESVDQLNVNHLIIDPGYLTVDWFTSKGLKPVFERSGAFNGGVSAILNEVCKAFLKDTKISINQHIADKALSDGFVNLMGKRYDFTTYQAIAERKASSIVSLLLAQINAHQIDRSSGHATTIDNVVLTGGGATYFEKPMREQFPGNFSVLKEPIMGNVMGYLEFGKRMAMQLL